MTSRRPPGRRMRRASRIVASRVFACHRAEEAIRVVDHDQIESLVLDGQVGGRRGFHVHEHAGICGAFLRARRRRLVGDDRHRAPREADLRGNRAESSAVRAPDLSEALTELHAGHADDERMRVAAASKRIQHPVELTAVTFEVSACYIVPDCVFTS